jgi:hypothetical protein
MDVYGDTEGDLLGVGSQLREDLAEAMLESPAGAPAKEPGECFAQGLNNRFLWRLQVYLACCGP